MLFSSPVYSAASGSIAGLVYSHNRAGMYTRARSTPTNPNSQRQRIVRVTLARLGNYWGQILTQGQRDAWALYGDNVEMSNRLGAAIFLTGQNHFVRLNVVRLQAGISILEAAPTIFDLGTFTAPTVLGVSDFGNDFTIAYTNTDAWANGVGGFMIVYSGRPIGPGRAFFGGPYRYVGNIVGDPVPPTSPDTFLQVWQQDAGNLMWIRIRVIQVDGRMSGPVILGPTTII